MDLKDHTIGHESHQGVHLCHRCAWPYPNPHPSAKHRRAHKRHCGTIEGYTNLTQVVSDDEEKTPSPKIEKKISMSGDGGGIIASVARSEEDLFSDAVTEFADSAGSVNKTLDRDLFFSFNDAENGGINDVVNTPINISNFDASPEVSEKQDVHVDKSGPTEVTVSDSSELTDKDAQCLDGLIKDGVVEPTPESSYVSESQEAKSVEVVEAGEGKSQTFEATAEEAKDSDISKPTPEVSETVGGYDDIIKQENFEKLEPATTDEFSEEIKQETESACVHVSEVSKEPETVELGDVVVTPEIVNESETAKGEKSEPDHEHALEAAKGSEIDQAVSVLTEKDYVGASKEQTTEKQDLGAPELEKCLKEEIQVVKESDSVLTAKEDLGEPILEEGSNKHTREVVEVPGSVLILKENLGESELEKCPKEPIQEVVKEPDTVLTEEYDSGEPKLEKRSSEPILEVLEKADSVLTQKQDLGAPKLEKSSKESQSDLALTEKEDLGEPILEEGSNKHTHEVVEVPGSVLISKGNLGESELEKCSKKPIQEVVKEPDTVLPEEYDSREPKLEKHSNEPIQEVVEKSDSILTQKQDLGAPNSEKNSKENQSDLVLTEKENLDVSTSEKRSNENTQEVIERKVDHVSNVVADVCVETITPKDSSDNSTDGVKNASGVVPKPLVEEGDDKLMNDLESGEQKVDHVSNVVADVCVETITPKDSSDNIIDGVKNASGVVPKPLVEEGNEKLTKNQESGAALSVDSSSRNSLEGNWGSVSVLSTASVDAEILQGGDKSKVNPEKSTATSDVYEPPSFMTLVEPKGKDQKSESSDVQDSKQQPNSEASKEGWFPTLPKVNNESEGRKRNEEAIAKVTNWGSGKQSTPLKNLLGEAKSPSAKQPESVIQKDVAATEKAGETPLVNQDMSSPPKLIEDGKKGGKKVKGRSSWIPFVCCSSVNVVK